jgi:hypothetical protein
MLSRFAPLALLFASLLTVGVAVPATPRSVSLGPEPLRLVARETSPKPRLARPEVHEVDVRSAPPPAPTFPLRRLLKRETTHAVALQARVIIDAHFRDPVGTEIPFVAEGKPYVARIERHYHPPGGDKKPWGEHAGVSVFVARPWP